MISDERLDRMVDAIATAAENGDVQAFREIANRLVGKATQHVEKTTEHKGGPDVQPAVVEAMIRIAERHHQRLEALNAARPGQN